MNTTRILVWDLPTRVFHWLFASTFAGAFLTAESERYRDLHVLLGYTFGGLLLFRLVWGFAGTRYARFASFLRGPQAVFRYLRSLPTGRPEHHAGHNPAGAWAILALLGLGLVTAGAGLALQFDLGGHALEEFHEGAANTMLALVVIHLAGVAVSSFIHRENLARAMVTGRKEGSPAEAIPGSRRWVAAVLLAGCAAGWMAYAPAGTAGEGALHATWTAAVGWRGDPVSGGAPDRERAERRGTGQGTMGEGGGGNDATRSAGREDRREGGGGRHHRDHGDRD